jgi:DNA-binding NtrC family response regulator
MTGYSTVQNAVEAMKLGALDYLAKPFDDDQLVLAVERGAEKKRLMEENLYLRKELLDRYSFENIIGESPRILEIFEAIRKVAPTDSTVLIYGESGTGKELFARAVHSHSQPISKTLHSHRLQHPGSGASRKRALRACEGRLHGRRAGQSRHFRRRQERNPFPG